MNWAKVNRRYRSSKASNKRSIQQAYNHETHNDAQAELERFLGELKRRLELGHEVKVKWMPGILKHKNGKQLLEEVSGNTIIIYAEDLEEAKTLLAHGFAEWLLNQHTRKYRMLINKLIELFKQIQYEEKEKIVDALSKLMTSH